MFGVVQNSSTDKLESYHENGTTSQMFRATIETEDDASP